MPPEPRFPNPPLDEIEADDLLTAEAAARHFGIRPVTIRAWVRRGKVAPVIPGDRRTPALYHLGPLAKAEKEAWRKGADRPIRDGRHPAWKPCTTVPDPAAVAA